MSNETARALEELHVHQVYEEIADHFSETRHKPWPRVMEFLQGTVQEAGSILVDVGCGNGKYLGHLNGVLQIGLDYSRNLLNFVINKGCEAVRSDALSLPIKSETADACISIAVIHHFSTEARRIKAVQELHRILRIGGHCLVYAWAKDQKAIDSKPSTYLEQAKVAEDTVASQEITTDLNLTLPVHENRTNFKHNDLLVPWKKKTDTTTLHRYYHVFDRGELESLVHKALGVERASIEKVYYDQGNWCIIFAKTSV